MDRDKIQDTAVDIEETTGSSEAIDSDCSDKEYKSADNDSTIDDSDIGKIDDDMVDCSPQVAEQSPQDRVQQILAQATEPVDCTFDKAKDEKIKNVMTYTAIPFILIGVGFGLFNMGRVRYPYSFLAISIAIAVLAVCTFIRFINLKKCNCSICEKQAKNVLLYAILWTLIAIGFMGAFIYYIVNPATVPPPTN